MKGKEVKVSQRRTAAGASQLETHEKLTEIRTAQALPPYSLDHGLAEIAASAVSNGDGGGSGSSLDDGSIGDSTSVVKVRCQKRMSDELESMLGGMLGGCGDRGDTSRTLYERKREEWKERVSGG